MAKAPKRKSTKAKARRKPKASAGGAKKSAAASTDQHSHEALSRNLLSSIIAQPLQQQLDEVAATALVPIIIDLNLLHPDGLQACKVQALEQIAAVCKSSRKRASGADALKSQFTAQYVFAQLTSKQLVLLAQANQGSLRGSTSSAPRAIYKLWPDFDVRPLLTRSKTTVKADAARISFQADGDGICWAVIDSGIDGDHPHFAAHANLSLQDMGPVSHMDFTGAQALALDTPEDPYGHGTHVAGIIAGEAADPAQRNGVYRRLDNVSGDVNYSESADLGPISGVAPKTRLISLRTLDEHGQGKVSNLIAALGYVLHCNEHGRWQRIHGVNLSIGYEFDAEWFACGQSPLCVEVDRLVRSGVSVVVAAGNTGYGNVQSTGIEQFKTALDLTINDPGNAELAITVGATHRDSPHQYGVSYFSSKGPTGDGRAKPDLVAPGEKIMSCSAGTAAQDIQARSGIEARYREESGTSMAAPHVSGCVAAFMSVRREFRGQPERLKEIFLSTATDLGRDRYFQGRGLVDLMRAIQSV
ncbi:MAG: S8 family peptidase [Pseudomonadales bacterium]